MKNKLLPILTVLIVLFGFISCPDKDDKDIAITLNSVTADGSVTETTTKLILTFNQEIIGLSANDISITGIDGVIKGTLTNSGASYTLPISGFSQGGTLSIAVSKTGYAIIGSPKNVMIYFDPILKSVEMQVYNTDKTTPYTGEDLNFFIQGESNTTKTIAATVKNGKLTINKINLPIGLNTSPFEEDNKTPSDLERIEIILVSIDNSKIIELQRKGVGNIKARMFYFNKNGSYTIVEALYNIVQGWNFSGQGASSATPDLFLSGEHPAGYIYVWVIKENT